MKYLKLIVGIGFILAGVARADDGTEFFEKKIRPVMVDRCYECHSATAKKLKGKFRLDTKEDFEKGGETGAAVVPGDPEKSLLIKAIRYKDEDLQMPPKMKKLPDEQIRDFEQWVKMGAPYPAEAKKAKAQATVDAMAQMRGFWSFVPPKKSPVPAVHGGWAKTEVDHFIQAQLEEKATTAGP